MEGVKKAKEPFRFSTRLHLSELTGLSAVNLDELLAVLSHVNGSSIYHHTHRFLQQHEYLSPEPPNDFAYWVTNALGEDELGERLASIDTVQFSNIRALREEIIKTISVYLQDNPSAKNKFSKDEEAFSFIKSISFVFPTGHTAYDLNEFVDVLQKITTDSIYFHIFEARLRLEKEDNDFSFWIGASVGDIELAKRISKLDPYTRTLEDLRRSLVKIIKKRIDSYGDN